jgi:hypothetical protein
MSEEKVYDAIVVRAGHFRTLHQGIKYEAGRAVSYRCPLCGALHPLDPRDFDEGRGLYVGRHCGGESRAEARRRESAEYRRERYASDHDYREAVLASSRRWQARRLSCR